MGASFTIIIPARYASTRLPGKPLRDLAGKSLIQRVYEAASSSTASAVYVATDDERIADVVKEFGGQAIMTATTHQSGTDRLAEAVGILELGDDDIVVNLQGDEPGMTATVIEQAANALNDNPEAVMSTIAEEIQNQDDIENPNVVKLVMDKAGNALYFSRSAIPFHREANSVLPTYRHVGLYAYRVEFLKRYPDLPACALEQTECLEQLRVLYNGERIAVAVTRAQTGIGIDTEDDVEKFLKQQSSGQ